MENTHTHKISHFDFTEYIVKVDKRFAVDTEDFSDGKTICKEGDIITFEFQNEYYIAEVKGYVGDRTDVSYVLVISQQPVYKTGELCQVQDDLMPQFSSIIMATEGVMAYVKYDHMDDFAIKLERVQELNLSPKFNYLEIHFLQLEVVESIKTTFSGAVIVPLGNKSVRFPDCNADQRAVLEKYWDMLAEGPRRSAEIQVKTNPSIILEANNFNDLTDYLNEKAIVVEKVEGFNKYKFSAYHQETLDKLVEDKFTEYSFAENLIKEWLAMDIENPGDEEHNISKYVRDEEDGREDIILALAKAVSKMDDNERSEWIVSMEILIGKG